MCMKAVLTNTAPKSLLIAMRGLTVKKLYTFGKLRKGLDTTVYELVIYCPTKEDAEEIREWLERQGFKIEVRHA